MDRRAYLSGLGLAMAGLAGCSGSEPASQQSTTGSTPADTTTTGSAPTETAERTTTTADEGGGVAEVVVGEPWSDDSLAMVVREVTTTDQIGQFSEADPGNTFVVASLAVKNVTSDRFVNVSALLQTRVKDGEGYTYQQTITGSDNTFQGGQLAPGEVSRGKIAYEVPTDAANLTLQFDFGTFSLFSFDRAIVDLDATTTPIADLDQSLNVPVSGVSDTVSVRQTSVTVNDVETTTSLGSFSEAEEGNEFVIVDITTTNDTDQEQTISILLQMQCKDGAGNSYSTSLTALSALDRSYGQGSPLAPGESRRGKVPYEVPRGTSPLYWAFEFSLWTEGDKKFWQLR